MHDGHWNLAWCFGKGVTFLWALLWPLCNSCFHEFIVVLSFTLPDLCGLRILITLESLIFPFNSSLLIFSLAFGIPLWMYFQGQSVLYIQVFVYFLNNVANFFNSFFFTVLYLGAFVILIHFEAAYKWVKWLLAEPLWLAFLKILLSHRNVLYKHDTFLTERLCVCLPIYLSICVCVCVCVCTVLSDNCEAYCRGLESLAMRILTTCFFPSYHALSYLPFSRFLFSGLDEVTPVRPWWPGGC